MKNKDNSAINIFTTDSIVLDDQSFNFFANKSKETTGIFLPDNEKNRALIKNRMMQMLRKYGLSSFKELCNKLKICDSEVLEEFISCITTNKTEFFREEIHFEFIKKKFSNYFTNNSELRIWCAACSTGQEPYSLAIFLSEMFPEYFLSKWKILATDIDDEVLKKAADGFYNEDEASYLPPNLLNKYFDQIGPLYRVNEKLSKQVHFSKMNLMLDHYPITKNFDIIFCRNVFIYFDQQTKDSIATKLGGLLKPSGYLFLGLSEAGSIKLPHLENVGSSIYLNKENIK